MKPTPPPSSSCIVRLLRRARRLVAVGCGGGTLAAAWLAAEPGPAPVIAGSLPAALTLDSGEPLALAIRAEGTGPLAYQWQRDGLDLPNATSDHYAVARAGAATAGRYQVVVGNAAGKTVSPACQVSVPAASAGRIERLPAFASKLVKARDIEVWLPPGYDDHPAARYPVVYMHDGQNCFDGLHSFGGESWEVDRAVCRLIRSGQTPGAIVVAVWNTGMGRYQEYMPQKAVTSSEVEYFPGRPTAPTATLLSDAYLKFLVTELKPAIDQRYHTRPDRDHTAIMGSSMGGLITAYAFVEYPQVFGRAACLSTHWLAGKGCVIDYLAAHLPPPGPGRIYFDYGTETLDAQYAGYQPRMDALLHAAGYVEGVTCLTRRFPGADHSEKSWRTRVDLPLRFLFAE